jgi:hypothetical protein
MQSFLRVIAATVAMFFVGTGICLAQSAPKPKLVTVKARIRPDTGGGTMIKKAPVASKDDIVSLQTDESAQPEESPKPAVAESAAPTKYTAEDIAAVQLEIKDKQKKVELLMRMFNTDERPFLNDPSGQTADSDAANKRRFEQEELRKTAAEAAALRAKLEQMMTSQENVAGTKP